MLLCSTTGRASMGPLILTAVAAAFFAKGVVIGLAIGGAAAACACRKACPPAGRESPKGDRAEAQQD